MAELTSTAPAAVTPEELLVDRQHFWVSFYKFIWFNAAIAAVVLILMAYFLV